MKNSKTKNNYKSYILYILTLSLITVCFFNLKKFFYTPSEITQSPKNLSNSTKLNKIDIEIFNGCNVDGLAKKYLIFLRDEKRKFIDVVDYGNADKVYDYTTLLVHKDGIENEVRVLAKLLGIDTKYIIKDDEGIWDVTIILGKDYQKLTSYKYIMGSN